MSCAQLNVQGTGSWTGSNFQSFPGMAYCHILQTKMLKHIIQARTARLTRASSSTSTVPAARRTTVARRTRLREGPSKPARPAAPPRHPRLRRPLRARRPPHRPPLCPRPPQRPPLPPPPLRRTTLSAAELGQSLFSLYHRADLILSLTVSPAPLPVLRRTRALSRPSITPSAFEHRL
jgi:hypothetical protein